MAVAANGEYGNISGHRYGGMVIGLINPYGISWLAVATSANDISNDISAAGVSAAAAADRTGKNALFRDHLTLVPAIGDMDAAPLDRCGDGVLLFDERASFMDYLKPSV